MIKYLKKLGYFLVLLLIIIMIMTIAYVLYMIIRKPYDTAHEYNTFNAEMIPAASPVEFWIGYIGIILSFISIVFVVITIGVQILQLRDQRHSMMDVSKSSDRSFDIALADYDAYVLRLIEKFLSPEMGTCRQRCWLMRQEILVYGNSSLNKIENLFKMQITDQWGTREEYERLQQTNEFKDYAEFTKLIRFFDMMSHYRISKDTAYAVHFYYVWWRSFLVVMIECFKNTYYSIDEKDRQLSFIPGWNSMIERMDAHMAKFNLPIN